MLGLTGVGEAERNAARKQVADLKNAVTIFKNNVMHRLYDELIFSYNCLDSIIKYNGNSIPDEVNEYYKRKPSTIEQHDGEWTIMLKFIDGLIEL